MHRHIRYPAKSEQDFSPTDLRRLPDTSVFSWECALASADFSDEISPFAVFHSTGIANSVSGLVEMEPIRFLP
jgi:hypothetical protein